MVIREVQDRDFVQLAEMRWTHAVEDDETYGEHNTDGVTKSVFIEEFVAFLYTNKAVSYTHLTLPTTSRV